MKQRTICYMVLLLWVWQPFIYLDKLFILDNNTINDAAQPQIAKNHIKLRKIKAFDGVYHGTFSMEGKLFALVGRGYVDIKKIASTFSLFRLVLNNSIILSATFSPDNKLIATASRIDESPASSTFKITLWDVSTGKERISLPATSDEWQRNLSDLSFSSDGSLLASNLGGIARLWNVADGTEARRFLPPEDRSEFRSERVLLSPDGERLAVYFKSKEPATDFVRIWNLVTGKQIELAANVYRDWKFSPDSNLLAVTAIQNRGRIDERSVAEIWNLTSGQRQRVIEVPREWRGAFVVSFAPDGTMLAIGGYKKFGIFSLQTGDLISSPQQHTRTRFFADNEIGYELSDIAYSPDGKLLLTGGNGTVKLWKIE